MNRASVGGVTIDGIPAEFLEGVDRAVMSYTEVPTTSDGVQGLVSELP